MKKTLLKGIVCLTAVASLVACSESDEPGVAGKGKISPVVKLDASVNSSRQSRAEAADITNADLKVKLTAVDRSYSREWLLTEFPVDQTFNIGDYTFEAYYGTKDQEGFGCPYFYGSQIIEIKENETTPITLSVPLANSMVSVTYSESLQDYMSSYSSEIKSSTGKTIEFKSGETRAAYVNPGNVDVYFDYKKQNGNGAKIKVASFTAKTKTHYHVAVSLNQETGKAMLEVVLDETTEEQPVTIELSDELENAPAPTIEATGFTPGTPVEFTPGGLKNPSLNVNIIARGKLGSVIMKTVSPSLVAQGWPAEIELLSSTTAQQNTLGNLGFESRGLFRNPDKLAVIDMSKVLDHISLQTQGDNISTFTFEVTDKYGKVAEQPLTLSVKAIPGVLQLSNPSALAVGDSKFEFDLAYNCGVPATDVVLEYQNNLGSWKTLTDVTYTETSESNYHAIVTVPDVYRTLKLRAKAGDLQSEQLSVARSTEGVLITPAFADVDIWATKATISAASAVSASGAALDVATLFDVYAPKVMLSTDGTNFTAATATRSATSLDLTGLAAGTAYTAKIVINEANTTASPSIQFTTEAAAQIPNGNLDAATSVDGSASNWQNIVFSGWGTNNAMTTSSGINASYTRSSGTVQTTDSKSGSAALLKTIGWGSGNTAAGLFSTSVVNKIDAGLLHLGATRTDRPSGYTDRSGSLNTDDLDCGIAFTSRPSAVKFSYKYEAKNVSDKGQVYVWVKDASGNIIAEYTKDLTAASSYTDVTLPLDYAVKAKAAKIYVRFMSTCVSTALTKNEDWISYGKPFTGSQLYIDEVQLTY